MAEERDTPEGLPDEHGPETQASGSQGQSFPRRMESLAKHRPRENRYIECEEVGRGGMGAVLEVWDDDLRRRIAMKIVRPDVLERQRKRGIKAPDALVRLLDEAQITGQLNHPGVVPVHELGVDEKERAFFTMQMVEGREFDQIIELARAEEEGWTMTRAVDCVLRVCETVAYAHSKGVIHRDLKPANVMVGEHGEVYVMDWGLAKVLGQPDPRDLSWHEDTLLSLGGVQTDRADSVHDTPDSPLMTVDGTVIGTPSYMPPEQAFGHIDEVGPHSDVYAVGSMLYHLLTGTAPYVLPGAHMTPQWILTLVSRGPPTPLHKMDPDAIPELVAICEKAMSRESAGRYPTLREMATDLRNYLEGRVVRAYQTGAWAEFKKWVVRNKQVAASLAGLLLVLLVSGVIIVASEWSRAALVQRELDEQHADNVVRRARELEDVPIHPDSVRDYGDWLGEARALVPKAAAFEQELASLRARAIDPAGKLGEEPFELQDLRDRRAGLLLVLEERLGELNTGELEVARRQKYQKDVEVLQREITKLAAMVAVLEERFATARQWEFEDEDDQRKHQRTARLTQNLAVLSGQDSGWIARIEQLRARASNLAEISSRQKQAWDGALRSIHDPQQCPLYFGMGPLAPQLGLVPLGRNPQSGLWEFWHVLSGEPPTERNGQWVVTPDTALVFVLVPGGTFRMGAEPSGTTTPDPHSHPAEGAEHSVNVEPYFLSKYEMTQEQWYRLTGLWPSSHFIGRSYRDDRATISPTHPVEFVSWEDCEAGLRRWSLRLPTESEWEKAARGGTSTPYYFGPTWDTADPDINTGLFEGSLPADGYVATAPVAAEQANPFGFHRMLGNVGEWCEDWHAGVIGHENVKIQPPHGLHVAMERDLKTPMKSLRGGSYLYSPQHSRVTVRWPLRKDGRSETVGIRPARSVERD